MRSGWGFVMIALVFAGSPPAGWPARSVEGPTASGPGLLAAGPDSDSASSEPELPAAGARPGAGDATGTGAAAAEAGPADVGVPKAEAGQVPEPARLLARLAETWNPLRVRMEAAMTMIQPGKPASSFRILIRRGGPEMARIDFLDPPKDRGKVMLLAGGKTWLYLPRAQKVVGISPQQSPLGGLMFDDLFPEELAGYEATTTELQDAWSLELKPKGGQGAPGRIDFDKSTLLPVRREIYARSGRLLRSVQVLKTRLWKGTPIPARLWVVDRLRQGLSVEVEILTVEELEAGGDALFDKEALGGKDPAGGEGEKSEEDSGR